MSEMFIVKYYDYDDCGMDSVWFDKELAQKRADELNAKDKHNYTEWGVEDIKLGDSDER